MFRRNPEEDLRNLEQLADQGDNQAAEKLFTGISRISPPDAHRVYHKYFTGTTILIPVTFTEDDLRDILISAFEGGIGYWAIRVEDVYPPGLGPENFGQDSNFNPPGSEYFPRHAILPLIPGGAIILADKIEYDHATDSAEKTYRLDREALIRGLDTIAKEDFSLFSKIKGSEFDAGIADTVIQYAVFGKIVYG